MYCPRCSQKHELPMSSSYCSGCGFYLAEIIESLENEGKIERVIDTQFPTVRRFVFGGMSLMVFGLVFLVLSLIIGTPEPSLFVQFNMLIGILASIFGVGFITYSVLPRKPKKVFLEREIRPTDSPNALPDTQRFESAQDYVAPSESPDREYSPVTGNAVDATTRKLEIDDKTESKG